MLYVGHAGHDEAVGTLAVAPDAIRLVERADDLDQVLADLGDRPQIAMLAQTTLAQGEWTGLLEETGRAPGDVWTASRNDLCFATTSEPPGRSPRSHSTPGGVIGIAQSANSSNTLALVKVARDAGL